MVPNRFSKNLLPGRAGARRDRCLRLQLDELWRGDVSAFAARAESDDFSPNSGRTDRRLVPTETGVLVNDLMLQYFSDIVDLGFTARMEEDLDKIAEGEAQWVDVMQEFYAPFSEDVKKAQADMPVVKSGPEPIGRPCPECGRELVIRYGRYGKFISCSGFPSCRYTEPLLEKIGVACPKDGGEIVERKTRKGRVFYGCINYPACDFTSWRKPLPQPCPRCGGLLVIASKREAQCTQCQETFLLEDILPETAE